MAEPFYLSPAWRSLLVAIIGRRGRRCEACGKTHEDDGSVVKLVGDHTVERRDGGADLDEANIRLLCASIGGNGRPHSDGRLGGCHNRKTTKEKAKRFGHGV